MAFVMAQNQQPVDIDDTMELSSDAGAHDDLDIDIDLDVSAHPESHDDPMDGTFHEDAYDENMHEDDPNFGLHEEDMEDLIDDDDAGEDVQEMSDDTLQNAHQVDSEHVEVFGAHQSQEHVLDVALKPQANSKPVLEYELVDEIPTTYESQPVDLHEPVTISQIEEADKHDNTPSKPLPAGEKPEERIVDLEAPRLAEEIVEIQTSKSAEQHATLRLHPVTVWWEETELSLYDDGSEAQFLLQDSSSALLPFAQLFKECRQLLHDTIDDNAELVLDFPLLKLCIREGSTRLTDCTLADVIDIYVKMSLNDGVEDPDPLRLMLSTESFLDNRINELREAATSGKGLPGNEYYDDSEPETTEEDGDNSLPQDQTLVEQESVVVEVQNEHPLIIDEKQGIENNKVKQGDSAPEARATIISTETEVEESAELLPDLEELSSKTSRHSPDAKESGEEPHSLAHETSEVQTEVVAAEPAPIVDEADSGLSVAVETEGEVAAGDGVVDETEFDEDADFENDEHVEYASDHEEEHEALIKDYAESYVQGDGEAEVAGQNGGGDEAFPDSTEAESVSVQADNTNGEDHVEEYEIDYEVDDDEDPDEDFHDSDTAADDGVDIADTAENDEDVEPGAQTSQEQWQEAEALGDQSQYEDAPEQAEPVTSEELVEVSPITHEQEKLEHDEAASHQTNGSDGSTAVQKMNGEVSLEASDRPADAQLEESGVTTSSLPKSRKRSFSDDDHTSERNEGSETKRSRPQ